MYIKFEDQVRGLLMGFPWFAYGLMVSFYTVMVIQVFNPFEAALHWNLYIDEFWHVHCPISNFWKIGVPLQLLSILKIVIVESVLYLEFG